MDYFMMISIIAIALVGVLFFLVAITVLGRKNRIVLSTDCHTIFVIGIVFLPLGIALLALFIIFYGWASSIFGVPLSGISASYLLVGWMNRNRWAKK